MECPICHEPCRTDPRTGRFAGCPKGCEIDADDTGTPTEKICLTCPEFEDCVMACSDYERWIAGQRARLGSPAAAGTLALAGPDAPEPSHFVRKSRPTQTTLTTKSQPPPAAAPAPGKKPAAPATSQTRVRRPLVKIDGANIPSVETIAARLRQRLQELTTDKKIPIERIEVLIVEKVG